MFDYAFFGQISAISLAIMVLPFLLIWLNQRTIKTRNKRFFQVIKFLRGLHKPLGLVFIAVALIHGVMVLGRFRLHTGWVLYIALFITAFTGGAFHRLKKRPLLQWHRRLALLVVGLFLLHFFKPFAI